MALNAKEELLLLIEKLPESKVEKVLDLLKQEESSDKFIYDNLSDGIDKIMDKHEGLLKRLAQ